jgi:hypothetical protein
MDIITKAFRVNAYNDIEEFNILIKVIDLDSTDVRYKIELVKKRLIFEQQKIIDILKKMENEGIIKSIFIPKNKKIQKDLDNLVRVKKEIKKSLEKIKIL